MRDTSLRANRRRLTTALLTTGLLAGSSVVYPGLPAAFAQESRNDANVEMVEDLIGGNGISDGVDPGEPEHRDVQRVDRPQVDGLPEGVSIDRVEWFSNRHIAVFINSAAMPEQPIQVQILLARDWAKDRSRTFPEVWALDGMRARDDENGWTIATNIEEFYADKNVNVILPVGGESSFYTDWQRPNNGKNYKWETFLTQELIPVLQKEYRSNGKRAVTGLSMGGTAAVNLAQRHPELFKFTGSFSGYLDVSTPGMPAAIAVALRDAGGYDATAMWGPFGSADWQANDPKLHVDNLRNMKVYVASGNGRDDYGQADSVANQPSNVAGVGLETLARMSSQTFVNRAKQAGVDVTTQFRPTGTHNWPYWQFEMTQAWPYMADALGIPEEGRGASCSPYGAIGEKLPSTSAGLCVNNEYPVADGRAQDFRNGTIYWSEATGAHHLYGRINARYAEMGGPTSWLGFPTTDELGAPDGVGRFSHFQNGSIYWTPRTGAIAVSKQIFDTWGSEGWETGRLGYPVAPAEQVQGGELQRFDGGYVIHNDATNSTHWVLGEIGKKYAAAGAQNSSLGLPRSNEKPLKDGGFFQEFDNGHIYWSPATGARIVPKGAVFDKWGEHGYENGEFGWPVSDETTDASGTWIQFQGGRITQTPEGEFREDR